MDKKKSALIAGATGLVGSECLDLLIDSDEYEKIVVFSRSSIGEKENHPKIILKKTNFDDLENFSEIGSVDHVFCALGTTIKKAGSKEMFRKVDHDYVVKLAEFGLESGAEHFLFISSVGANPDSSFFYNKVKGETESELSKLNYRAISIFQPSLLLGDRNEQRFGEDISKTLMTTFDFLIPKKYKAIEAKKVAAAMLYSSLQNKPGVHIFESDKIGRMGENYFTEQNK